MDDLAVCAPAGPRAPAAIVTRRASALALLALLIALAGCGSSLKTSPAASVSGVIADTSPGTTLSCPATVLDTLGRVVDRVYREGVVSERTQSAKDLIEGSTALRSAVEAGDATAARAAAKALIAGGHMTDLLVQSGGRTLIDVGGPALAPVHGTLRSAGGATIATYTTSVWSDAGFLSEAHGISEGLIALRVGEHSVGGSYRLPHGPLATEGSFKHGGDEYQYSSFAASEYPNGDPLRVYLVRSSATTDSLCAGTSEDTLVNTLKRIADLIYQGEAGKRTEAQIRHVQGYAPLVEAVAAHNQAATRAAIFKLLYSHTHIVRMRVSADGKLLSDVGGPYVLAPVTAPLRLHGRTVGSAVISIQDDEGYLRLTGRLAGLKVLMYMGGPQHLVKNSLGPNPGTVPASGSYTYRGNRYRVFTVDATAFPSGPLTIRVLVPIPYS